MKLKLTLVTVLFSLFFFGAAQADKIRIATEGAYPPFNMKNTKGELTGFDVEIAKALCEQMKADCEIVAQDWDGIIPGLLAKKYDAIIASMSITAERQKKVSFTDPYYSNYLRFIAKKNSGLSVSKSGLKGKNLGAQNKYLKKQKILIKIPKNKLRKVQTPIDFAVRIRSKRKEIPIIYNSSTFYIFT